MSVDYSKLAEEAAWSCIDRFRLQSDCQAYPGTLHFTRSAWYAIRLSGNAFALPIEVNPPAFAGIPVVVDYEAEGIAVVAS